MAIQEAWNLVMSGAAEFCVAGGADSYVDDDTLAWIEDSFQLHNASNAYGFIPGEAAGLALLTSKESASEHHLGVLAEILSITTTQEHHRIKTDSVCTGVGMTEAVRQVLRALPDDQSQVDQVFCDQNGETYRANEYGFTLTRTGEWFVDGSDFLAPADCWGDVGAASGPLLLGLASSAASGAYTKGPLSLLSTSSEGGHRCVALVRTRDEKDGPV
jgi:3-oxoacyl-[acyl-carrier-protein] synthase-1